MASYNEEMELAAIGYKDEPEDITVVSVSEPKIEVVYEAAPIIKPIVAPTKPVEPIEPEPFYELSAEERRIVENIVMGESGGESYLGQRLVALCILNASLKDNISPSEVRVKYQYAGWNESPTDSVKDAVSSVFDDGDLPTEEQILYFYAPKWCKSAWHETQRHIITEGGHKFFAEWSEW
jgi:spore germination cell wall hydrolase CwlJ-like protein